MYAQLFVYFTPSFVIHASHRIRLASCMSFGIIVTRLACIAHRFVSSKRLTRKISAASCKAMTADDWKRRSVLWSWAISLISLNDTINILKQTVMDEPTCPLPLPSKLLRLAPQNTRFQLIETELNLYKYNDKTDKATIRMNRQAVLKR